jgi:hypothetical protein
MKQSRTSSHANDADQDHNGLNDQKNEKKTAHGMGSDEP